MTLVKYNPGRNLLNFRSNLDHLFDEFFGLDEGRWPESTLNVVPAVNLEETEDAFIISAELPGMSKKDIAIKLENNILSISGEKKAEKEQKGKNFHRVERSYGKFHRAFELPGFVQRESIDAAYENGVLSVKVPKAEEAKPKQIDIKVK